jgi:hypothetical protein
MPPTIIVTVGMLDAAAAFEPVVPELKLVELPELLQAAMPATRAAALTAPAVALSEGLNIGLLLVLYPWVVSCG